MLFNFIALLEYTLNVLELHLMLLNVLKIDLVKKTPVFCSPHLVFMAIQVLHDVSRRYRPTTECWEGVTNVYLISRKNLYT